MYYEFDEIGIEIWSSLVRAVTGVILGYVYHRFGYTKMFRFFVIAKMVLTLPLYLYNFLEWIHDDLPEKDMQPYVTIKNICYYGIVSVDWGIFLIIFI